MPDPRVEKLPQNDRVPDAAHHVSQHELRAQAPPEEAKVAGVSERSVDAVRDEGVALGSASLNLVVERDARVHHGRRADGLAGEDEGET